MRGMVNVIVPAAIFDLLMFGWGSFFYSPLPTTSSPLPNSVMSVVRSAVSLLGVRALMPCWEVESKP